MVGVLIVCLERHFQTIDYFFFISQLVLQVMEHLTAGTFPFLLFSLAFFTFATERGVGGCIHWHSLGSSTYPEGDFYRHGYGERGNGKGKREFVSWKRKGGKGNVLENQSRAEWI